MKMPVQPFNKINRPHSIEYKVHGFWATDYIYIDREDGYINWSCSGRDHEEEPFDLIAIECFSLAMQDAVEEVKKFKL